MVVNRSLLVSVKKFELFMPPRHTHRLLCAMKYKIITQDLGVAQLICFKCILQTESERYHALPSGTISLIEFRGLNTIGGSTLTT